MTRKNQKPVMFYLSDKEKEVLDKIKGNLTYREYILNGYVVARPKGRPPNNAASLDTARENLEAQYKRFREDHEEKVRNQLVRTNRKGLSSEVLNRMYGDTSGQTKVTCNNCTLVYHTLSKNESKCWRCGTVNKTPIKSVVLPLESTTLNKFEPAENLPPNTKGNLSEGYNPYENPGSFNQLVGGGVADRSVIGEDHSRFKYPRKKKER